MQPILLWVLFSVLIAVLLAAAVSDWRTGLIPNRLTYGAILLGLVGWTLWGAATAGGRGAALTGGAAAAAFLVGAVPAAVAFALGGLGGGDVKLIGAIGALSADWRLVLAAAVYAVAIGAVMAAVAMVRHGVVRRTLSRLACVALQAAARVRPAIPGGSDSPKVPFGVALAIGGVLAALEHQLGVSMPWAAYLS